jgi:hypothetical protein
MLRTPEPTPCDSARLEGCAEHLMTPAAAPPRTAEGREGQQFENRHSQKGCVRFGVIGIWAAPRCRSGRRRGDLHDLLAG